LKGDKPPLNNYQSLAIDHQRERLYFYGGARTYDDGDTPTCDFFCLDLRTMKWQNLTNSLRFRPVPDPFAKNGPEFELRSLPALTEPAIDLMSLGDGTFLFLFGGHDSNNPTGDLIAIDLDEYTWWFVDVASTNVDFSKPPTPIKPRLSASMVALDNQLFIFGGRTQFEDDSVLETYSVAVYNSDNPPKTRWTWTKKDQPMPPLGFSIQAIAVYNGEKILLTQGRIKNDKPIDLSRESTYFFHTKHHTFQNALPTMGDFPTEISWLQLGSFVAGTPSSAAVLPRRRGGPPKNLPGEIIPAMQPNHTIRPSVVIFGWVKYKDHLVAEGWQYVIPPTETIRCLNLSDMMWDLDLDLQFFASVGNRLFLIGSEG
ncbi:hypothetical protein B0H17DRAFT_856065, partial [Mycena rosella]